MTRVVADASVVIKCLIDEEHSQQSQALIDRHIDGDGEVIAPVLLQSEVINVLLQRTRRREYTTPFDQIQESLAAFLRLEIQLYDGRRMYERALEFAHEHRLRATYDSQYVVLAEMLEVELWTADQAFVRSVEHVAPWVRWIGDYSGS